MATKQIVQIYKWIVDRKIQDDDDDATGDSTGDKH